MRGVEPADFRNAVDHGPDDEDGEGEERNGAQITASNLVNGGGN